ncbi:MAG TPA: sialate O-acetylesterase, partial [Candidatus Ozemobacteraceae bacterium]|nr:sialate O-acetylesterase [Candidatus Ozemobacteraceae bacterium]
EKDVKTLANRAELAKKADELNKVYLAELAASTNKAAVKKPNLPWNHQSPSAIYNTMVDGMTVMPIKGAIWYQGESNAGDPIYDLRMQAMLSGWAKKWGYVLPFYYVQLANFQAASEDVNNTGWGRIRQSQLDALKLIPQSGMAVTIDIGEAKDIHPKNKFDVGERLARWALRDLYGKKDLVVSGPLYKSMKIEGSKIRVSFDYADCCGLMVAVKNGMAPAAEVKDGKLEGFAIQAKDGKWFWADAAIDGTTVLVSNAEVKEPVNVRYAYQSNPKANLYNKAGLPASPFTTVK